MVDKKIYLTLWYYSITRGRWVVTGETDQSPVVLNYDQSTLEGTRFRKYAAWLKNGDISIFLEAGKTPVGYPCTGYPIDPNYVQSLPVLTYRQGSVVPSMSEEDRIKQEVLSSTAPLSDKVLKLLSFRSPIDRSIFGASDIQWKLVGMKLKNQIIIEGDQVQLIDK